MTFLLYIGLALFVGLCGQYATRTGKKAYIWAIIIVLTLVAGLRSDAVGFDTLSYLEKFKMIRAGRLDLAYGLEESFKYIVFIIQSIIPSGQFVILLLAFLTNWCIITRFWELRSVSWFTCMTLCYYMSFFFTTMNTSRQFCAVAIIFYSVRFLDQKRLGYYIAGVFAAMLLHRSAAVGVVFVAIYCLRWRELPQWQKKVFKVCGICTPVLVMVLLLTQFFARYAKYFSTIELDIGFMLPLKLLLAVLALGSYRKNMKLHTDSKEGFMLLTAGVGYAVALLFGMLGYIFHGMDRISWYFFLYEGVYIGTLLREKEFRRRMIYAVVAGSLILYGFGYSMFHNSQGQMPYKTTGRIIEVGDRFSICDYAFDENGNAGVIKLYCGY